MIGLFLFSFVCADIIIVAIALIVAPIRVLTGIATFFLLRKRDRIYAERYRQATEAAQAAEEELAHAQAETLSASSGGSYGRHAAPSPLGESTSRQSTGGRHRGGGGTDQDG